MGPPRFPAAAADFSPQFSGLFLFSAVLKYKISIPAQKQLFL